MKTRPLFHLLTALSILLAGLPIRAVRAALDKSAAPADLLAFTSGGHALGFASGGVYAAAGSHALRVDFIGANRVQPQSDPPASPSDSVGAGSGGKVAPLDRVTYAGLWDGIVLTYTAGAGNIYTTTYELSPGADPAAIRLRYNAPLSMNEDGTLSIGFDAGVMTESAPAAWQVIDGRRIPVDVSFKVDRQEAGFVLGAYDPHCALTIDPSLVWNTFLGGTATDEGYSIAVDGSGNVYVSGYSSDTWGSPVRAYTGGNDPFVAKLNSSGALVWNTFLGGSGFDSGMGVAVDGSGNVYVAGYSNADWIEPPLLAYSGGLDGFVAKLNSSGAMTWHTFLGGSGYDAAFAVAVDGNGNIYASGNSDATWGSPVRAYTGSDDAFAVKLNSSGALTWSTFLGGNGTDYGYGIAVDGSGNVYLAGNSGATWGSPVRAITDYDAYAAKMDSSGGLTWNTFLGGVGLDEGKSIAVDGGGNVYVAGYSVATWGSPVRAYNASYDGFAAKLNASGGLTWNTFLGAGGDDIGNDVAVDGGGNVYVAGYSNATWGSPLDAYTALYDAFAVKLNSSGVVAASTFLGGAGGDQGYSIAVDGGGAAYVSGRTDNATWGAPVRPFIGSDAFAAKAGLNPPGAFTKLAPANSSFATTSPNLSWGASSGADYYYYCIDTVDDGSCNTSWEYTGTATGVALSGLTSNATYYWEVLAYNATGNTGADGGVWWSFTARTQTFADVPVTYWAWSYIERLFSAGITGGCATSPLRFCPASTVTRAEMAIFLERGMNGPAYTPPAATGGVFGDVPISYWAAAWIEKLSADGITGGCGGGNYCPAQAVTRAEMAIFLLRAKHGSAYTPPAATGVFGDVPPSYWAANWIEQLYNEGITGGCGGGNYCPAQAVTRAEMAIFIVRTFGLP